MWPHTWWTGRTPLSGVEDVFNAIAVRGNAIGDVMFYGRGAGKLPTASAVVADVIDAAKHRDEKKRMFWAEGGDDTAVPPDGLESRWYLRGTGVRGGGGRLPGQYPAEPPRSAGGRVRADHPAHDPGCPGGPADGYDARLHVPGAGLSA